MYHLPGVISSAVSVGIDFGSSINFVSRLINWGWFVVLSHFVDRVFGLSPIDVKVAHLAVLRLAQ